MKITITGSILATYVYPYLISLQIAGYNLSPLDLDCIIEYLTVIATLKYNYISCFGTEVTMHFLTRMG